MEISLFAYLVYNLVLTISVERYISGFFDRKRTGKLLLVLSYTLFYAVSAVHFLTHSIPAIMLSSNFVLIFLMVYVHYKSSLVKRFFLTVSYFVLVLTVETAMLVVVDLYTFNLMGSISVIEDSPAWIFLALGVFVYLLVLVVRRMARVRSNAVELPKMFLLSAIVIPLATIGLNLVVMTQMTQAAGVTVLAISFVVNAFVYYMHDLLSAAYEAKLLDSQGERDRMKVMLDLSPIACDIVRFTNGVQEVVEVNRKMLSLLKIPTEAAYIAHKAEYVPTMQPDNTISDVKIKTLTEKAFREGHAHTEWMAVDGAGTSIPCELIMARVQVGDEPLVVRYMQDLREVKDLLAMKNQMEQIEFIDVLTGLYNRRYFVETAGYALAKCKESGQAFSIILIDLDKFEQVNDMNGHAAGDEILRAVAERLKKISRADALVARYSGDEFVIMLAGDTPDEALTLARRAHACIREAAFTVAALTLQLTASVGVATVMPGDMADVRLMQVVELAATALTNAKAAGRDGVNAN